MSKKTLYLLMQAFPLKDREKPFISPELPFLKEKFDITVVPLEEVDAGIFTRCTALLKSIFSPLLYNQFFEGIKAGKHPAKVFAFNLFVMWRAQTYAAYLKKNVFTAEDAVVYTYWYNELALGALLLKKKYPRYSFITRCHGYDLYDFRLPSDFHPYKNYMDSLLDKVFFISHQGKQYYLDRYGKQDNSKYNVSYLGVSRKSQKQIVPDNTLHIVSCSNVIPLKRVSLICDALSLITDFPVVWHHFGDGSDTDNVRRHAAILPSNIEFNMMGRVPNTEYMNWLENNPVDLFINVSTSEGLPVSLMEAASFGIPCIATDVGGSHEIVSDANGILLCSNPTAEELARAIKNFHLLPASEKQLLGQNAYKVWQNNFDCDINSQKFADIISEL
ncbi:MAG: glycosyltransferase [Oscillospiraceae bacterium]|nr:glycosyltransferase [Oscillospiraceae bacterium]